MDQSEAKTGPMTYIKEWPTYGPLILLVILAFFVNHLGAVLLAGAFLGYGYRWFAEIADKDTSIFWLLLICLAFYILTGGHFSVTVNLPGVQ